MQVTVQFVNTNKHEGAEQIVRQKLEKLSDRYSWVVRADVFFKEEKGDDERGKICEIRISAPGPRLFAESGESSFDVAASETIRDIERQLEKRKSEMYAK